MFVGHNRYCSFGLALSSVIDIALVVAICKVTIFMAISVLLFSPVLLLYLAMVIVDGDYGWLLSPVLWLKEQHLFLFQYVSQKHEEQCRLYHFTVWMGSKYLVGNIRNQVKDDGYHHITTRLEV